MAGCRNLASAVVDGLPTSHIIAATGEVADDAIVEVAADDPRNNLEALKRVGVPVAAEDHVDVQEEVHVPASAMAIPSSAVANCTVEAVLISYSLEAGVLVVLEEVHVDQAATDSVGVDTRLGFADCTTSF